MPWCPCRRDLGLGIQLSVKVPRPGEAKRPFRSSSQATTCYNQSNHSKVEANPLSTLPKDTTSELAGLPSHYPWWNCGLRVENQQVDNRAIGPTRRRNL